MHKLCFEGNMFLPISALVQLTFGRTKSWFVGRSINTVCILLAEHQYPEDITTLLERNEQCSTMCHVYCYNWENFEFNVQKKATLYLGQGPMLYIIKLNDWWCDYKEFQALQLPYPHVITICPSCHL